MRIILTPHGRYDRDDHRRRTTVIARRGAQVHAARLIDLDVEDALRQRRERTRNLRTRTRPAHRPLTPATLDRIARGVARFLLPASE